MRARIRTRAPLAVNQIVRLNDRLEHDIAVCVKHEVPIMITSCARRGRWWTRRTLRRHHPARRHQRHARKATEAGVDGPILVCAGAGGQRARSAHSR
jgi:nitronate monooxygenase